MTEMTAAEILEWDYVSSQIGDTIFDEDGPSEDGTITINEDKFNNLVTLVLELRRAEGERAYREGDIERTKLKGYINLLRNRVQTFRGVLTEAGELFQDRLNTLDVVLRRTEDF